MKKYIKEDLTELSKNIKFQFKSKTLSDLISPEDGIENIGPILTERNSGFEKSTDLTYISKNKNKVINILFLPTAPTLEDYRNQLYFSAAINFDLNTEVKNVILYTEQEEDEIYELDLDSIRATFYLKSLKHLNADEKIEELQKRRKLNEDETATLFLTLFMKSEKTTVELFKEIAELSNKIKMNDKESALLKSSLFTFGNRLPVSEKVKDKMLETIFDIKN